MIQEQSEFRLARSLGGTCELLLYPLERDVRGMLHRFVKQVRQHGNDSESSRGGPPRSDARALHVGQRLLRLFDGRVDRERGQRPGGRVNYMNTRAATILRAERARTWTRWTGTRNA